nr:MAG TPA: hypothetical protein [Bacteriophage sp.]
MSCASPCLPIYLSGPHASNGAAFSGVECFYPLSTPCLPPCLIQVKSGREGR